MAKADTTSSVKFGDVSSRNPPPQLDVRGSVCDKGGDLAPGADAAVLMSRAQLSDWGLPPRTHCSVFSKVPGKCRHLDLPQSRRGTAAFVYFTTLSKVSFDEVSIFSQ